MSKFYGIISGLFMRNKFKIEIENQNTISYECVICFMDVEYIPYVAMKIAVKKYVTTVFFYIYKIKMTVCFVEVNLLLRKKFRMNSIKDFLLIK